MCETFLKILLPPPDIRELLSTQKETYHLTYTAAVAFMHVAWIVKLKP